MGSFFIGKLIFLFFLVDRARIFPGCILKPRSCGNAGLRRARGVWEESFTSDCTNNAASGNYRLVGTANIALCMIMMAV